MSRDASRKSGSTAFAPAARAAIRARWAFHMACDAGSVAPMAWASRSAAIGWPGMRASRRTSASVRVGLRKLRRPKIAAQIRATPTETRPNQAASSGKLSCTPKAAAAIAAMATVHNGQNARATRSAQRPSRVRRSGVSIRFSTCSADSVFIP